MCMTHTNTLSLKEMMILINLADNLIVLVVNKDLFILPAHKSVHHMHSWCPRSSEEGTGHPGTDGCKLSCRC